MEYGTVTIDYRNKKFYFSTWIKNGIDASEKKFPIDFVPINNQLYVSFVWDTKISDKISKGDQIISIDNVSYDNISICTIMTNGSIFKNKNSVKLTTKNQNGELLETVIERK